MSNELLYQLALTHTPNIGNVAAKKLMEKFELASNVFEADKKTLSHIAGISTFQAESIRQFIDFDRCEKEVEFIEKNKIQTFFLTDKTYPQRLLRCFDSPTLLFYKGSANLNASRMVSIIGTRSCTDYGKYATEKLIADMEAENISIISGMAYGIDSIAHKAALKHGLPTIGVMAHGLHTIYPADNSEMAKQMINEGGGLLTEFVSETKPDKHNFPIRNRIVAGMTDATIIMETDARGGSMITAELAVNYNKDVFAFPGKTTDSKSRGCNKLIRQNKAALITGATDMLEMMNWLPSTKKKEPIQRQLFIEMTKEEKVIFELLNQSEQLHVDELYVKSGINSSSVAGALLSLELQNMVQSLPGKLYRII